MVICLEGDADLHMAQLMRLPLTVSCFSKIQISFTFLVPADPGSPGKRAVKRVCDHLCILHISLFSLSRCFYRAFHRVCALLITKSLKVPKKMNLVGVAKSITLCVECMTILAVYQVLF